MLSIKFIIAQIIGIVALFVLASSFQKNDKETLLKHQIYSNVLHSLQFFFLEAYTGCLLCLTGAIRNYIFSRYKDKVPLYWLVIIVNLMIGFSLMTYKGPISLLPMFGIVIYSVSTWTGNLKFIRIADVIVCLAYIPYDITVLAIADIISATIELISSSVAIYRFDIKRKGNIYENQLLHDYQN